MMRLLTYFIICGCLAQNVVMAKVRIVGGEDATIQSYPWMVLLAEKAGGRLKERAFCGGTLIHPSWVLTAGHCILDESPDSIQIITGITNLVKENGIEQIDVEQIVQHPDYYHVDESVPPIADIALLKLAQPSTQPIIEVADPYSALAEVDQIATVLGWGALRESGNVYPDVLQQVSVPIVSHETCNGPRSFDGDVQADKLCAGYMEGGKDACQGDGGGPLVVLEGKRWKQIGIVSFGDGCARPFLYGVYTNVLLFQEFITQHLCTTVEAIPPKPALQISVNGARATAQWDSLELVQNYQLYYAPYSSPRNEIALNNIHSLSMDLNTQYTTDLPKNSEYYVAIRAYRNNCPSLFSDLAELFVY